MVFRCKGLCEHIKAEKLPNGLKYKSGQKHCTFCSVFVSTPRVRCPCCNGILRTGPRSRRNRLDNFRF